MSTNGQRWVWVGDPCISVHKAISPVDRCDDDFCSSSECQLSFTLFVLPSAFSVEKPLPHLFFPDSLYHCILCILYGYAIQTVIMRSRTANAFLNLFPRTSTAPASCFGCSVRHKHLRTHAGYNSIADNTCSSGDRRTWSIHFKCFYQNVYVYIYLKSLLLY